jgi:hypothetical protein
MIEHSFQEVIAHLFCVIKQHGKRIITHNIHDDNISWPAYRYPFC